VILECDSGCVISGFHSVQNRITTEIPSLESYLSQMSGLVGGMFEK